MEKKEIVVVDDGIKEHPPAMSAAGESRIWSIVNESSGRRLEQLLLYGLPLSPDLRHHHHKHPCNIGEQGDGVAAAGATAR